VSTPLFPEVLDLMRISGTVNGYGAIALFIMAGVLGFFGFRWWRSTAIFWLALTITGFVFTVLFGMATVYHEERNFLTRNQYLNVPDGPKVEGDRSNDGLRVTFTLSNGKSYTLGPNQQCWYDHHNFVVNWKGSLYSNSLLGLGSILAHVGAWRGRVWYRRRRSRAESAATTS
jgi:hypothetical protein